MEKQGNFEFVFPNVRENGIRFKGDPMAIQKESSKPYSPRVAMFHDIFASSLQNENFGSKAGTRTTFASNFGKISIFLRKKNILSLFKHTKTVKFA